jgi:hypothetical protein
VTAIAIRHAGPAQNQPFGALLANMPKESRDVHEIVNGRRQRLDVREAVP